MKSFFCMTLFIFLSFSVSFGYSDLDKSHWAFNSIEKLSDSEVFVGYSDGSFKPDNNMTRAEFLSVLIKSIMPNVDVSSDTEYWADRIISLAAENNIVKLSDYNKTDFDKEITRLEIFNMIFACLDVSDDIKLPKKEYFTDIDSNSNMHYITAILSELDIIKGYPDGSCGIGKFSTRAEVACIISNFIKNRVKIKDISEVIIYYEDKAIVSKEELPYSLKIWKNAKYEIFADTKIKDITIFPFNGEIPKKYKSTFDTLFNDESLYCKYRVKFGENNYVLAIDFETTNNTSDSIIYAGHEFLRVSFPEEDIRFVDKFDTDEIRRQLNKDASVGERVMPGETRDTSAFYVIDEIPQNMIRLDRDVTTMNDVEDESIKRVNSFTTLLVKLGGNV